MLSVYPFPRVCDIRLREKIKVVFFWAVKSPRKPLIRVLSHLLHTQKDSDIHCYHGLK